MKKLLLVIPFLLVACDASHDVEWYKKHEKERKATIQECKKDADELQKPDCKKRARSRSSAVCVRQKDGEINSPKI